MNSAASGFLTLDPSPTEPIQEHTDSIVDDLLASLPRAERLSAEERRGIIARYTAVLEGNFIYWMTAAYLSPLGRTKPARSSWAIFAKKCAIVTRGCSESSAWPSTPFQRIQMRKLCIKICRTSVYSSDGSRLRRSPQ